MSFTPPKVDQNVWATHVEGRRPAFKVHSSRGLANSAISNHYPDQNVVLYHLENNEWVVAESYLIPEKCAWCSGSFVIYGYGGRVYRSLNRPRSDNSTPKYLRPVICKNCYADDEAERRQAAQEKRERKQLKELQAKYVDTPSPGVVD